MPVQLTEEKLALLKRINREVNSNIKYKTDIEQFGVVDKWVIPEKYGDCDDYVLLKRLKLMQAGWNPFDLKVTICMTELNEGHAVLSIDTDKGTYILDNRYPELKTFKQLANIGYKFIKRQSGTNWVKIERL